jgi:hypothetical protein
VRKEKAEGVTCLGRDLSCFKPSYGLTDPLNLAVNLSPPCLWYGCLADRPLLSLVILVALSVL